MQEKEGRSMGEDGIEKQECVAELTSSLVLSSSRILITRVACSFPLYGS